MKSKFYRRGFTLIELLVVIAIIAILAAILFPVFARARENARRTNCISNLKQIGLGIMQYTQDYDERYPGVYSLINAADKTQDGQELISGFQSWQQIIYPYVKSHQMYFCPNSPSQAGADIPSSPVTNPLARLLNSNYGYNSYIGVRLAPISLSAVQTPATTYMIAEAGAYSFSQSDLKGNSGNAYSGTYYLPGGGANGVSCTGVIAEFQSDCRTGRHFDGVTVAFADGHTKWLKSGVLVAEGRKYVSTHATPSAIDPYTNNPG